MRIEQLEQRRVLSVATLNPVNDAHVITSPAQLVHNGAVLISEIDGSEYTSPYIQFDLRDFEGDAPSSAILELHVVTNSGWDDQTFLSVDQNFSIDLFRPLTDDDPVDGEEDPWENLGDQPHPSEFDPDSFALVEVLGTTDFQTINLDVTDHVTMALLLGDADISGDFDPLDDVEAFYVAATDWQTYRDAHPFSTVDQLFERLDANRDGKVDADDLFKNIYIGRGGSTLIGQNPGQFMSRLGVIPGDVNLDGVVNSTDQGIVNGNMNQAASSYGEGDVDLDGVVTSADLTIVSSRQGQGTLGVFDAEEPLVTFTIGAGNEGYVKYASNEYNGVGGSAWRPKLELDYGVPQLSSNPSASKKIFLDFDGHDVTGTVWNSGNPIINAQKFDLDGNPSMFNAEERFHMELIWSYVAEDFRPFNVDVTTVDPSIADPDIFTVGDEGLRVLFTSHEEVGGNPWLGSGFAGIAWPAAPVFAWHETVDMPVFVLTNDFHELSGLYVTDGLNASHTAVNKITINPWPVITAGTVASHEIGHAFGLFHDGLETTSPSPYLYEEYYGGYAGDNGWDGSGVEETGWAPIMGGGEIRYLTQWSKGEYFAANNLQDDLDILDEALGYRSDDYTSVMPVWFSGGKLVPKSGVISESEEGSNGTNNDVDTFSFTITGSADKFVAITASPEEIVGNLDIGLRLYNSSLTVDVEEKPNLLASATIAMNLAPGTYFLEVDGVGRAANTSGFAYDDGYSDYGSLGRYHLSGSMGAAQPSALLMAGNGGAGSGGVHAASYHVAATPQAVAGGRTGSVVELTALGLMDSGFRRETPNEAVLSPQRLDNDETYARARLLAFTPVELESWKRRLASTNEITFSMRDNHTNNMTAIDQALEDYVLMPFTSTLLSWM